MKRRPYERRFEQPFQGPIVPFGSLVEYHPITAKSYLYGSLNTLCTWGEFRRVTMVADIEELETMDTLFEEKVKEIFLKGLHLYHLKTHFRMLVKI